MRGADKDEIILDILKEGAKTTKELRSEVMKRGVSKSTYDRHIKKLIRSGEVKVAKYEIIPKVKEANRKEVEDFLEILTKEDSEPIIFSRLKQLTALSYEKRVAHHPFVIWNIERLIEREIIVGNVRSLNQFFAWLNALLSYEEDRRGINWEKIVDRLVSTTIEKAKILLMKDPNDRIIEYLGRTNRKYAVEILFEFMEQLPIEAGKNEFYGIARALSSLYEKNSQLINEQLDSFLRSKEKRLNNLGLDLREKISQRLF